MFKHSQISAVLKILEVATPESFGDILNVLCENLSFDAAAIYASLVSPRKLAYFAGIYKGKPFKETPLKQLEITPSDTRIAEFFDPVTKISEIIIDELPPDIRDLMHKYNIKLIYRVPLATQKKNYGILFIAREEERPLTESERFLLETHIQMLEILLDIYQIKWIYDVVRDNIQEHVIIQDLEHNIIQANKAASLSLGIENPDELKGKKCYELWHRKNYPCESCPLEKTRLTKKPEENEVMTPEGRWFHIRSNPIFSGAGELIGFVELTQEITEKVQAEKEVKKFQEILKRVFDQPLVGIVVSDLKGNIIEANFTRAKMLGLSREELLSKNWKDYTHPDDVKILELNLNKLVQGEIESFTQDVRVYTKGKDIIYQRINVVPLRLNSAETNFITMIMDITSDVKLRERLEKRTEEIILSFSRIVELKEPYTAGHQQKVAELAVAAAKEMGLPKNKVEIIKYAGLLHDIGKIIVPIEILNKPAKLSEYEFNLVKEHPKYGYEITKGVEFDGPVAEIIYQHHERYDGSGYPRGLKGDEILLEARIIACADVIEAMTSHRPYRPALPVELALEELITKKGILYDPKVVEAFKNLYNANILKKIIQKA
ncbi:MAG: HD domain-containing phosphohydrolase [candidate division WOR-3 bacterium]